MEDALGRLHQLIGLENYLSIVVFHELCQTALLATLAIHLLFGRLAIHRGQNGADKETTKEPPDTKPQPTNAERIEEILRKKPKP